MDGDDGMTMSPSLLCSVFSGFEEERAKLKERTAAYEKEKWYFIEINFLELEGNQRNKTLGH